jgi:hypothetical protein
MENGSWVAALPPSGPGSIPSVAEQLRDDWERGKGNLRQKYAELTDQDFFYAPGSESALIDRIRQKTGCSRAEIEEALKMHD